MFIHKEGFVTIFITVIFIVVINFLTDRFVSTIWIRNIILLFSLALLIIVLQFFRNPMRKITECQNCIIAPADGKVVVIENVFEKEYLNSECIQISIFMSPFNVHVNRNPVSGVVKYFKYHPGKYLVAWHPKSSELNERTTTVIENKHGHKILFRQIAGALARRICWYVKEGDSAIQGREMGFIKFGSRVDVFLPKEYKINVKIDEKTIGGKTIIAKLD
ncbi:MAG: phosphatidylserine decarboxylase family protein [Bacteroidetes bacterium]|nr:phosphatidylserine decarboxylase family protein [Bacteroidota bacterium]